MRIWTIIFFFLPLLGCVYAGWHVWRILPLSAVAKAMVLLAMLACILLLFVNFSRGLDGYSLPVARVLYAIGTSSVVVLLYMVMLFLMLDLGRLVHLVPATFLRNSVAGTLTVLGTMVVLFAYGRLHYEHKVRVPIELKTDNRLLTESSKKVVLISDLHLGYHNTRADFARWVDMLNAEHPDLILIAGDIIDISVKPIMEEGVAEEFRRLTAPVYACLGNHEYYAGEPGSEDFYRRSGIHLLRDRSVTLFDGNLTVIGRDDRTNLRRKSIGELVADIPDGSYTILLDHQPMKLDEAEQAGIDFQFSGHTHYGQVWPVSWIEDAIYECAYGSHQRGNTRYYVTSGIGIWGGKFRIGTQSEYVVALFVDDK